MTPIWYGVTNQFTLQLRSSKLDIKVIPTKKHLNLVWLTNLRSIAILPCYFVLTQHEYSTWQLGLHAHKNAKHYPTLDVITSLYNYPFLVLSPILLIFFFIWSWIFFATKVVKNYWVNYYICHQNTFWKFQRINILVHYTYH
jgi:hypothetical protein